MSMLERVPLLGSIIKTNRSIQASEAGGSERLSVPPEAHGSLRTLRSFLDGFTSSQRTAAVQREGVGAAAFLIRDAVYGEAVDNPAHGAYDPYLHPENPLINGVSVLCRRICSYRPIVQFMRLASWILFFLTFIEPPPWCRYDQYTDSHGVIHKGCQALLTAKGVPAGSTDIEEVLLYPNSSSTLIDERQSFIIESICVGCLILFTALKIARDGMSLSCYFRPGTVQMRRIYQLLGIIVIVVSLIVGKTFFNPYARLVILASFLGGPLRDLRVLVRLLPPVFDLMAVLLLITIFYAWFGTVMFVGTEEGAQCFPNIVESMWTLYICVTTANYPDVMMSAYNDNRWVAIYFISFMMLSFFFIMNLVLATVVNEYESAVQQRREARSKEARDELREAFRLLDPQGTGTIDRETVMALFVILNEDFYSFKALTEEDTKLLFAILDKDGSSTITEAEFLDFGNVILLEFVKESEYETLIQRRFPKLFLSNGFQKFSKAVKSNYFEYAVDLILVANAVIIAIQSYPELSGQEVHVDPKYFDGSIDTIWELMETMFTCVYAIEVLVKVMVYGWRTYIENKKNMFDLVLTILAVVTTGIVYYPNQFSDTRLVRMIVMARVLRLLRLLTAIDRFKLIGAISAEILPDAANVLLVLFYLLYFFASIAMQLYGGMITRDPNNPLSEELLNTDFSDNAYWGNNFNDMISGLNVLFNLLVINNWTECEIGFEAVTGGKLVRFYFLAFWICGVILVNNLVVAFVINNFFEQLAIMKEKNLEEVVDDGEAIIRDRRAVFDGSEVTGTKTSLSGGYIARLRRMDPDTVEGRDQDRLRSLFTHSSSMNEESKRTLD